MIRSIALVGMFTLVLALTGCVNFPKKPSDLSVDQYNNSEQCFDQNESIVYAKVRKYFYQCIFGFSGRSQFITEEEAKEIGTSNTGTFLLVESDRSGSKNISVLTSSGYSLNMNVSKNNNCEANLKMYAVNTPWSRYFKKVDSYIRTDIISCPL